MVKYPKHILNIILYNISVSLVLIAYAQKLLQTPMLMLARGLNVGLRHPVREYFVYATSCLDICADLNKHSVLENVVITKISCIGSCIVSFHFLHPADAKNLSVCPSVRPSVRTKCTREILHLRRNYLKYMSTNKTNESVSSDEPVQICRLIRAREEMWYTEAQTNYKAASSSSTR